MSLLFTFAVAPVALLLIYIYKRDVIAKEPSDALIKAFVAGAACTILDLIILLPPRLLFGSPEAWDNIFLSSLGEAYLEAGIPEELCKFVMLYWFFWKSKYFDEHFDGIVYATFVSMGFACIENIMYVFVYGYVNAIVRAFTAVPMHFFAGVIMGYYFSRAKFFPNERRNFMLKAISIPIILHGAYDTIVFLVNKMVIQMDDSDYYLTPIILLVIFFFFFNFKIWKHGKKRIDELRNEDINTQNQMASQLPANDQYAPTPMISSFSNNDSQQ